MALLFIFFGDYFEEILKPDSFNNNFSYAFAWCAALGLMISDLFLPIPASAIMSAVGSKYGFTIGILINFSGLLLSGTFAYFVASLFSTKGAKYICSEKDLTEYKFFFNKWGGASIILSRALPILPEVTSLMAGFVKMEAKKYFTALFLGSFFTALLYTWIGHSASDEPIWGIAIAVFIPLILWILASKHLQPKISLPDNIQSIINKMHELTKTKQFDKLKDLFEAEATITLNEDTFSVAETIKHFHENFADVKELITKYEILDFSDKDQYYIKIDYKESLVYANKTTKLRYLEHIYINKNNELINNIECSYY